MITRGVADIAMYRFPKVNAGRKHFEFIQTAIDVAGGGNTFNIGEGEYPYPLDINGNDIILYGMSRTGTILMPRSTLSWAIPGYPQYDSHRAAIKVYGSFNIQIKNMTLDFDYIKGNNVAGILYWNSEGNIEDNTLQNMNVPDASGGYYELMCYFRAPNFSPEDQADIVFRNNTLLRTGRVGVVTHDHVNCRIEWCLFDKIDSDFGYGIEVGSASAAFINENTIRGYNTWAATDHSASAGIYVENSFTTGMALFKPVSILHNDIYNCQYGVYIGNSAVGYAGDVDIHVFLNQNDIHDNSTIPPEPSGGVVVTDEGRDMGSSVFIDFSLNNIVNNGDHGIYIFTNGNGDIEGYVEECLIANHDAGLVISNFGSAAGSRYLIHVQQNSFINNTINGENNVTNVSWDNGVDFGNCWSDFPLNPGYPTQYNVPGAVPMIDHYPAKNCGNLCDCFPGDPNGNGIFNIQDITYTINFLYKFGAGPMPYPLCSGDANCDCKVNISDITFLINYLYKSGAKPCDCAVWAGKCGLPLRK
jgi:hypothetical protein